MNVPCKAVIYVRKRGRLRGWAAPWLGERLAGPPLFVLGAAGSRGLAPPLTPRLGLRDPGAHASAGDAPRSPQRAGGSGGGPRERTPWAAVAGARSAGGGLGDVRPLL